MDTHLSEIYRLWKAWTTIVEMLIDRKYELDVEEYLISFENFNQWVGENEAEARKKMYFKIQPSETKKGVCVFWKELLGTADILDIVREIDSEEIKHAIVVHNNKVTPYAATALRALRTQKKIIEVFSENELQYNVTRHQDVPQHIICSSKTKAEIFAAYSIDATKITKIMSTEPVLRYYGAVKGQLIKIVRPSDSIPEVEIVLDSTGKKEKKMLYDITYKIVV